MTLQRLQMPRIPRREVATRNRRHTPRQPVEATLAGSPMRLSRSGPAEIDEPMMVQLAWAGYQFRLRCPTALVRAVLAGLEPSYAHPALPADDLLPLLLQLAAGDWPVEVAAAAPGGSLPDAVAVTLHAAGQDWPGELAGELSRWPEQFNLPAALPLSAAIRFGVTRLPIATVASLQEGDAVLMQTGGDRVEGRFVVAESWLAGAAQTVHGWRLSEAPRPASKQFGGRLGGDWLMTGDDGEDAAARPEDIAITLTFDVGRTEVTVGELARLGAGSILELGRGPAELVEIRANGRRIGRGELVEIDGAVGVRIIRLFDAG